MSRKGLNSMDFTNRSSGRRGGSHVDDWSEFEKKVRKLANDPAISKIYDNLHDDKGVYYNDGSFGGGFARCYESHPPLKLPGTEFVIYGGSCSAPIVKDADIYIGFDSTMKEMNKKFHWIKGDEVRFLIPDMGVPKDAEEFRRMVEWVKKQLAKKAKIHAGCIGGHGRTGTFLAALVSLFGEQDAVEYVRKNYCHKAVESATQTKFLTDQFGIKKAKGHKSGSTSVVSKTVNYSPAKSAGKDRFAPLPGQGGIW
jgi:protein-tyrosine phosphatase